MKKHISNRTRENHSYSIILGTSSEFPAPGLHSKKLGAIQIAIKRRLGPFSANGHAVKRMV